jgi:hypothetical protein
MSTLFAARSTKSFTDFSPSNFSGVVLSSSAEIRGLREVAGPLCQGNEAMIDPEFFLPTMSKGWRPRVVAVYSASEVVGVLYTKERVIAGIPTGIVYGDGSLGGMLVSNPEHQQKAFGVAMEVLLESPGIRGARLRVLRSCGEIDGVRQLIAAKSMEGQFSPMERNGSPLWKYHAHLQLADTYEHFLGGLGSTTRHNFRYYRRRFEAAGHKFEEQLSTDELRSAALELRPKSKFTAQSKLAGFKRTLDMVAATHRPLAIGLKHRDGQWLSVIGGWYRPGGAVLCFQCNYDCDFDADSLSTVLRAYLIELLIRQGLKELVIWGDTGPPLSLYASYPATVGVRLDVPTVAWRAARYFMSKFGPHLPRRLASAVQWMC